MTISLDGSRRPATANHGHPHEGLAAESLNSLLLRFVQDENDTVELREMLSGFTHRCRNLLNGMKMSLYFVHRQADGQLPRRLTEVEQTYSSIERLFDQIQQIYRPVSLTPISANFSSPRGRSRKRMA